MVFLDRIIADYMGRINQILLYSGQISTKPPPPPCLIQPRRVPDLPIEVLLLLLLHILPHPLETMLRSKFLAADFKLVFFLLRVKHIPHPAPYLSRCPIF
jgi:hypothetical protein